MLDPRARLAALGVAVFDAAAEGPATLESEEYPALLAGLVRSGDARLRAAIPCLLALHDGPRAADAARHAIRSLPTDEAASLALLYRIARCLAASRAPDLRFRGLRANLPPIPEEPPEIPGPEERSGERGLWIAAELAREHGTPDVAGGTASMFDLWLRPPFAAHEPMLDPYTVALSKIERGHDPDIQDVAAMVAKGIIDAAELRRLFEAILPAYQARGVRSDPARFRRMLELALSGGQRC